jgi:ribonuclease P protein component
MFPRNHRLTSKAEYQALFDKSTKINQPYLLMLFKTNQKLYARLGLAIGKRVVNNAVDRNKIKRVIRESFRGSQKKLQGLDIIILARQKCGELSKKKLREGIEQLWKKLLI